MFQNALVVEDESFLLDHLNKLISAEGFNVQSSTSIPEIEQLIDSVDKKFDLIILDRLLHGRDAGELLPKIKTRFSEARVLVLSAINTPSEKASMLDSGADDYLAKPFEGEELVARVRALLRRNPSIIRFGNLVLNLEDRKLWVGEKELSLTNKEFLFLKTLMKAPGKIFSKNFLYESVWELSPDVESNALETTVNKLRRRLEECGSSVEIRNSRNVGYWIEE